MSYINGNPGDIQRAAELVISNFEAVGTEVLNVKYPDIRYLEVLPAGAIDTSASAGADIYSKILRDRRGVGDWRAVGSNAVPQVGYTIDKISVSMYNAGISSVIDLQDLARSEQAKTLGEQYGINVLTEVTDTMRLSSERHIEKIVFFGDAFKEFEGYISNSNVPATTVDLGASGFTEWDTKTPDEIIFDVVSAITRVYENSRSIFIPTHCYLPLSQYNLILALKAGTRANDETVYNYLRTQTLPAKTYGEFKIEPLRYLAGAGAGSTDRMMLTTADPSYHLMSMPIPFRLLSASGIQDGYNQKLYGEYKFSGVKLVQPLSFDYSDGI